MRKETIPFSSIGKFSSLFTDYVDQHEQTKKYYSRFHSYDGLLETATSYSEIQRSTLVKELQHQYQDLSVDSSVTENILSLGDQKTFTVTTGHQLQLATGPLFFIYKIITTLNLANELKLKYPEYKFVPIFWMASEDHDFEEINHFHLFGKKHEWLTDQRGAVGRFDTKEIIDQAEDWPSELDWVKAIYANSESLAQATRTIVNKLFGKDGLVILDADCASLKGEFKDIIRKELFSSFSKKVVDRTSQSLVDEGYKAQVHAREINLFYLKGEIRERFVKIEGRWNVNNTDISFSEEQLEQLIENEPEVFSPNVILRPVYQQRILPNISYVGGPGELIYWLQLKDVFEECNVDFPVLTPRSFALYIPTSMQKKLGKSPIHTTDLFLDDHSLKTQILELCSDQEYEVGNQKEQLNTIFNQLITKGEKIDPTLKAFLEGEQKRSEKQLDTIEKKLKKAEERKLEQTISQAQNIKNKLFPNGGLQERHDNVFNFLINNDEFIATLQANLNPFDLKFNIVYE